jgi:hypothetical protein
MRCGTLAVVLFVRRHHHFLPRAVTMPDDTEAAALHARLEAIIKKAEDAEAQAISTRCHV